MRRTAIARFVASSLGIVFLAGADPLAAATSRPPAASVGAAFDSLMPAYDAARRGLATDRLADVAPAARNLRQAVAALGNDVGAAAAGVPEAKHAEVLALLPRLRQAANALAAAATLPSARDAFFDVSKALIAWRKLAGKGPDVGYCSMAKRSWLQPPRTPIENPYEGKSMASCGERQPS
jgi:hypothetical protein